MDTRATFGLLGSALLLGGVFTPVVSFPVVGSLDLFRNGEGDGVIIFGLAVASALIVAIRLYPLLFVTGCGSALVLWLNYQGIQERLAETRADMDADLADNPFRGLADLAMNSVQLEWGWAVLAFGTLLLIAAAFAPRPNRDE